MGTENQNKEAKNISHQFIAYGDSVVISCKIVDKKGYLSSTGFIDKRVFVQKVSDANFTKNDNGDVDLNISNYRDFIFVVMPN